MAEEKINVLISKEDIAKRVKELGQQISNDYKGETLVVVGILKGSVVFLADLIRELSVDVELDFMAASSYGDGTSTSGTVNIKKDLDKSIEGRNVLIVEDIIDSGLTLNLLTKELEKRNPKTLRVCTILDKPSRRKVEFKGDYVGFEIEDLYIIGYGLDAAQKFRQLPDICYIEQ